MKPNPLEKLKVYEAENTGLSLEDIYDDLEQISKIKKCSNCGCNANTLKEFQTLAIQQNKTNLAEKARALQEVVERNKRYECINCNPCYPADISNLLFEMNGGQSSESGSSSSCGCSTSCVAEESSVWPLEKGKYFVGHERSTVAICTLADTELPELIHTEMNKKIAIVGYCETENIGIEKVVKNLITNSHIRYLVLCGKESGKEMMGHFSGQAILSLHENGINENGRIVGAKGKRPILKNLSVQQVQRFQTQIGVIDQIGIDSVQEISGAVNACLSQRAHKFNSASPASGSRNLIEAKNPKRLVLDKKGFFVILPEKHKHKIFVEYYANSGQLLQTIVGNDAASLYYTIIESGFISKLDHAAYLGRELTKAEYLLKHNIPYVQDKALGELETK